MKGKECLILTFFCMCFALAVMYGFFELGGGEMKICNKYFCLISIVLIVIAVIFLVIAIFNSFEKKEEINEISSNFKYS